MDAESLSAFPSRTEAETIRKQGRVESHASVEKGEGNYSKPTKRFESEESSIDEESLAPRYIPRGRPFNPSGYDNEEVPRCCVIC